MNRKYIGIILTILLLTITQTNVFARRKPVRRRHRIRPHRKRVLSPAKRTVLDNRIMKKRHYIRKHDLNGDGIVDYKDKIKWINTHPVITETVIITEENNNLLSDLDLNEDGLISPDEVKTLFDNYDTKGDGKITEEEISSQE